MMQFGRSSKPHFTGTAYTFIAVCVAMLWTLGCQNRAPSAARITIQNDATVLAGRISYSNSTVSIDTSQTLAKGATAMFGAPTASDATLTLVAEVAAPVLDGKTLQATEVHVLGNKAYVTYNYQGEIFAGGIEVFDITHPATPELISSALFNDTDVNGAAIHGNTLYLASATENPSFSSPAILEVMDLQGGLLSGTSTIIGLQSYAATSVDVAGNNIYVTTGTTGGMINVLSRNTLAIEQQISLNDARGVDTDANDVAVVAGTNAKLMTLEYSAGTQIANYSLSGATIANSKSTVEVKNGMAILGMGDGGVQVVCMDDGALLAHINPPIVAGSDPNLTVTNAVTAFKRAMFIANGEAGIYLALANTNFNTARCVLDGLTVVGRLQFGAQQSVNHILYRADTLFIAAGTGGLKIVNVNVANSGADDDDAREH